jgi:hypothetical protein
MDGAITKIKSYKHSQWKAFQSAENPFKAHYVSLHDCKSGLQNHNISVNLKKHYQSLVKYYDEKYPYLWEVEERLMNEEQMRGWKREKLTRMLPYYKEHDNFGECKKYTNVTDMLLHLIEQGELLWGDTDRKDVWMISHDALAVMWEMETLNWLKQFKCPIVGWEGRTWYDRIIKIGGKWNDEVDKSYQNKLPGDSPELMPNDNHLNADVKEGACRNVALTYFLEDDDPDKYSFRTPKHAENAIYHTMKAGCPSSARIVEDCNNCIANLKRVVAADGCYISDNGRAGVRDEGRRESKESNIMLKSDPQAVKRFEDMFSKMKAGKGLPKELISKLDKKKQITIEPEEIVQVITMDEIVTSEQEQEMEEGVVEVDVDEDSVDMNDN